MSPDELVLRGLEYARIYDLRPTYRPPGVVDGVFSASNGDAFQLQGYIDALAETNCPGISGAAFQEVLRRICDHRSRELGPARRRFSWLRVV